MPTDILGCKVSYLPMKYLGLPIRARLKAQVICDGVLKRMKKRLPGWKNLLLIQVGRFTLIKRMLSILPTYFILPFPLPAGVANVMEKIFIKNLWGGMGEEFKFYLVNWNSICKPIQQGCSGIRKLWTFNQTSLVKWLWRYTVETDSLWRKAEK